MRTKKISILMTLILGMIIGLAGCSQEKEKSTLQEIAPVHKDKISTFSVTRGNSGTTEFTDREHIKTIVDRLEKIKFSKMNLEQEKEVFQEGRVFSQDTTYFIQLLERGEYNQVLYEVQLAILSETELILNDSATIQEKRTISYINQKDEASLEAVKELHSLVKTIME
ncbi:hypothetical protein DesLBE_5137 [Desulfitobacterium sp. LBE]|uniref:hypothetical protein n=1 Tax=Desulfitobacterium sp. LBE TaxID=884086 RepID=UPI00119ADA11|nr:hypothetical protein [Desulfitobacterium sp. LBE]TWH60692.1 hypothetical protein DesLBE_5137 [Desulfitobacterium sp. LBE]